MKQVPKGGTASIWRHRDLSPGICTSLPKRVKEPEEACVLTILPVDTEVLSVSGCLYQFETFVSLELFYVRRIKLNSVFTA